MNKIRIEVPATTANLGPCFDTCGIAFQLFNYFTFFPSDKLIIEGCEEKYANESNLVYQSFQSVYEYLHKKTPPIHIVIEANVPVSRGLGSSSTCIVGGILGANKMLGNILSDDEILMLCTKMEGHPDNVAPCLFGGLVASLLEDTAIFHASYPLHKDLRFCAFIPDFELSTSLARSVLPHNISLHDCVTNIAHATLSIKAWETKNYPMLKTCLQDYIHTPYRSKLIHEYDEIHALCDKYAKAFFISGAGPTLMGIYEDKSFIEIMKKEVEKLHYSWKVLPLEVDYLGAIKRNEG